MICERCKQHPATVHYTEVINDQKRQMHLCTSFAEDAQKAFDMGTPLSVHNFLAGLMSSGGTAGAPGATEDLQCENCGLSASAFGRYGLLGCGACYRRFGDRLEPVLRRIHGSTRHTGKVPRRSRDKFRMVQETERLRASLQAAVEKEEFERAAELRDRIRALERRLS